MTNNEKCLAIAFLSRLTFDDIRRRSQNDDEAYAIQNALVTLRQKLLNSPPEKL